MLRFKQFISLFEQLILEGRIDFLKKQYKDKLSTDHDQLAQHQNSDDIIDHFASNADPTGNKIHTQWILNRYREGSIRQEDHPRIREALSNFEKYKAKLPNKDIGQYKTLSDVEDAVEPHLDTAVSKRQETKAIKSEGAQLLHSENGVTVHDLKTKEAACEYGKGTRWCTAATKHNMFDSYKQQGPLYFIRARDHSGSGAIKKYQYHPATQQLMDEKDKPVQSSKLIEHNPEILNSPIGKHFKEYYDNPDKISDAITNNPDPSVIDQAMKSDHVNERHIRKLLQSNNSSIRKSAIKNPKATTVHISKALDDENSQVRELAILHPNATADHITKALDDDDVHVKLSALKHRRVDASHITKALADPDIYVRGMAVQHRKATPTHVEQGKEDPSEYVRDKANRTSWYDLEMAKIKEQRRLDRIARKARMAGLQPTQT